MPIINLIATIIVLGVVMWLVNTYIPMPAPIRTVLNVVVVILLILWLVNVFGLATYTIPVRR